MPIPGDNLKIDKDDRSASVRIGAAAVIDEPKFPEAGPVYSAQKSFNVTWQANDKLTTLEDEERYFRIRGYPAHAKAEFSVIVPEMNFSFHGTATSTFAFFGSEVNGQYYMQDKE